MSAEIYYNSKLGSTKKYAKWLCEKTSCKAKVYQDYSKENVDKVDTIIVMSGTYAMQMPLVKFLKRHWKDIKNKKVVVVAVGMAPANDPYSQKSYELIPAEIRKEIKYFKLPGKFFSFNKDAVNQRQLKNVIKELQ
jgi:menaquinone-dependent protoporphyrinogen IX oxidase